MKKWLFLFALILCTILAGCHQPAAAPDGEASSTQGSFIEAETPPAEGPDLPPDLEVGQVAMVYIGTKADGFTDYPMVYDGELTPEKLIQGIADLTGWDLTLAEPVTSGKDGMSVCLSDGSALFTGPPDPQREAFLVYDAEQLAEMILDSIQKTLQEGFTLEGGDSSELDIWYYMEGELPLSLPDLHISFPIDQPYQWTEAVRER